MLIVNVKGLPPNYPGITYVGRTYENWIGSPLGNQFKGSDAVKRFSAWLFKKLNEELALVAAAEPLPADSVLAEMDKLSEISVLGCWCCVCADDRPAAKRQCHAEVISAAWRWLNRQGTFVEPSPVSAQI